ncbi:sister chromatid cohesion protein DCC1-like isoform X1 [Pomacea canaliculata]|uniref:sister chromatid cohesion protein DCC1-like isoform X1 n=1 Tax=Pomacea canaliculata TaxID=400727 RepID=UPI000D727E9A|nr:sister chromatid cohesion protein DCC1-like isoform X1 [Pomacea canaliculata]
MAEESACSVDDTVKRSLDDVNTVLTYAKLDAAELHPHIQTIFFSKSLENDAVKLLELDTDVLCALEAGERVVLRGDKDDTAVLCTKNKTFDLKEAELSNSMLLLENLSYGPDLPDEGPQEIHHLQVSAVLHKYFELRIIKPRLQKLKHLLDENQYSGQECEEDPQHQGKKYTMDDFLNRVQASEQDITDGLKKLRAFEFKGFWRVLDFDHLSTVLSHVIQLSEEGDWINTGIPLAECIEVLQELFPREVIQHVVSCYAVLQENNESEIYRINEDKVCQFYAEVCLRNAGKFNLQEFLQVWEQSVPLGMKINLSQVEGVALIDRESKPETISFFSVEDLPEEVSERFDYLFDTKKKWTLQEISPYVSDLTTDKLDVGALLTKYARASVQNGVKVFSSRKAAS